MAQTLGNARPRMHHLIMGGPAPNGGLAVIPAAHALPGCIQNPMFRQSARGIFLSHLARANDRFSLLRFPAEFAIGSWAIHFTIGAPWQCEHRLSSAGGSALIHR